MARPKTQFARRGNTAAMKTSYSFNMAHPNNYKVNVKTHVDHATAVKGVKKGKLYTRQKSANFSNIKSVGSNHSMTVQKATLHTVNVKKAGAIGAGGLALAGGGAYAYHHRTQIKDHAQSFKGTVTRHRAR